MARRTSVMADGGLCSGHASVMANWRSVMAKGECNGNKDECNARGV